MATETSEQRRLLQPFTGRVPSPPPLWLMRQAGRYLPEYRAVRTRVASFLDLCYSPELAAEVTLQPIRRYDFDAAILFSDILVVADALGQRVEFVDGEGPRLQPIRAQADLARLNAAATRPKFARVCETVARLRQDLPRETALIGFCGAPWTVATYMVGGQGSADQRDARLWAYRDRAGFAKLIDILVEVSIDYLSMQVEAGADVLQLFDTWAGGLPPVEFDAWVIGPSKRIVSALRAKHPGVPVIGFPRGVGTRLAGYVARTGVAGVSCDTATSLHDASLMLAGRGTVVQGNLDPLALVAGGPALEAGTREILQTMQGRPFVFNLGHGILPETPVENVARLVEIVRSGGA